MRVVYIGQDRPDLSFAAGNLDGTLGGAQAGWPELEGHPVGTLVFEPQVLPGEFETYFDADHAADRETRKSRSGMAAIWGKRFMKRGSSVRSTIALSSGESEYYVCSAPPPMHWALVRCSRTCSTALV